MARQESFLKLKGRVGDLTFYKSGGEYLARTKGGVDGDRIKNDPRFARTRENGQEFLRAVKSGKLLRDAFREQLYLAADRGMSGRLTSRFSKVVKSDSTSSRGERTVSAGDVSLLDGFEFNGNSNLENLFFGEYGVNFAEGVAEVTIEAFDPSLNIQKPDGATHAQFVMIAGSFDFDELNSAVANAESASIDLSENSQDALTLTADASGIEGGTGIVMLGILFWQEVNGELYKINNGAKNALRIISVA
ncbi:hypothetical protein [Marinilabilia rubra]|uniref:Uncharacterized protein n=1 Tax=Marinilabilia rubra TaxID=2162893 RepID=A0A2U2BC34_9BACT|nr:hypothetical protein [Marinilabilia rubra]PWE00628.1 hypothetical protein DDZ16_03250 [Marinilabilia rubra]